MKALQATHSIPRFVLTKALGRFYESAYWGPQSQLQYREVPEPPLPGPQWVRIKTRYGGICGSDLNTISLRDNFALWDFGSFPLTLGHENVGTIVEMGAEVEGFSLGDRVVVEPLLPCATRGIEDPCEFCQQGDSLCQHYTEGEISAGLSLGT